MGTRQPIVIDLTGEDDLEESSNVVPLVERPSKRRRTDSTPSRQTIRAPAFDLETTGAYLTDKLWPQIEEAIERLAPACEPTRRTKLHFTVHNLVVNNDQALSFQNEWLRSKGSLSREFEASITQTIEHLVLELKDRPVRASLVAICFP